MEPDFRTQCLQHLGPARSSGSCLIIGEVAQSHDGSLGMAHAFIDSIADAGADAVKFQTHIAAAESTPSEPWRVKFSKQDRTRYDYWKRMEFSAEQWFGLKQHADERDLLFLSTPFSSEAIELLSRIGMMVWKIASGEVGNLPMLELIAPFGRPVILSSGMSDLKELDDAVRMLEKAGNPHAVLQCTSAYPCPPEKVGLNMLEVFKNRYSSSVGLSDHSGTIFPGLAAVTLGAEVVEVHVALSREMFGPDVSSSLVTTELAQLVNGIRSIEKMVANPVDKDAMAGQLSPLRGMFTKSIVVDTDLSEGTILQRSHFKLKKPGTGLPASKIDSLVGKSLRRDVKADQLISINDVEI
ncbi:MAG: N-acetylneuraminate synthase family protein [Acidobacteriota bacterium]